MSELLERTVDLYRTGQIYFVTDGEFIKIGHSGSAKERLTDLQCSNARQLRMLGVIPGTLQMELNVHALFRHLHVRGEWFKDTGGEIARYLAAQTAPRDRKELPPTELMIEAASDMLKALRGLVKDVLEAKPGSDGWRSVIRAKAAIERATGRPFD